MDYLFKDLNLSSINSSNMSPLVGKETGIMNITNRRHIVEISEASDLQYFYDIKKHPRILD